MRSETFEVFETSKVLVTGNQAAWRSALPAANVNWNRPATTPGTVISSSRTTGAVHPNPVFLVAARDYAAIRERLGSVFTVKSSDDFYLRVVNISAT